MTIYISIIFIISTLQIFSQKENKYIREGNKDYYAKKYGNSEVSYQKALEINPNSFEANYNLANAIYTEQPL